MGWRLVYELAGVRTGCPKLARAGMVFDAAELVSRSTTFFELIFD
jgi:hypothetical protein